jgi:hypothetical protein
MFKYFRNWLRNRGYDVVRFSEKHLSATLDEDEKEIYRKVKNFTMTSPSSIFSLINATKYIVNSGIDGAFVECGVWRGGAMMAVAETLKSKDAEDRLLYLYDTYQGMTAPTDEDISYSGDKAYEEFQKMEAGAGGSGWCLASIEEVVHNVLATGYEKSLVRFIKGKVEDTIPSEIPKKIALLRLDTDWYESTKHELEHLYPLLASGGVLIIDDYGYWEGSKKAVDEYLAKNDINLLLNRVCDSVRIAIKP